ncbi:MAG: hypothetical protein ACTHLO_01305 [Pseudolabrys sp.]
MRSLALIALAAVLAPAAAQAQYASAQPAPLYPYAVQPGQPYAIEVAPGTYVIKRPAQTRSYPYVSCGHACETPPAAAPRKAEPRAARRMTHNDPALIEELRRRHAGKVKHEVVNTTKIVRDKPVVIEHQRVVDDPPRVIERRHYVDDDGRVESAPPPPPRQRTVKVETEMKLDRAPKGKGEKRVIRAEAEVTILGPDRMSIRLFRKGKRGADVKAEAE